MTLKPMAHIKT